MPICVVSEALRMYPPLPAVPRTCTEDYPIPDSNFTLEKGSTVMVPILGIHRDPENFPEPDQFKPERFNEENIGKIKPYTYLPFGLGPRNCLGDSIMWLLQHFTHLTTPQVCDLVWCKAKLVWRRYLTISNSRWIRRRRCHSSSIRKVLFCLLMGKCGWRQGSWITDFIHTEIFTNYIIKTCKMVFSFKSSSSYFFLCSEVNFRFLSTDQWNKI